MVAGVLALFAGGSAHAKAAPEITIVREQAPVASCKALGEVRASSMVGGAMANAGYDRALRQLKERAAKLGATHVLLIDSSSGMTGARMLGNAYSCGAAKE